MRGRRVSYATSSPINFQTGLGGPIFDPGSDGADGSMLVLALENVAAVTAELEKDPYWTGNIVRVIFFPLTPYCSRVLHMPCSGIKKISRSKRSTYPLLATPPRRSQKPELVSFGSAGVALLYL